MSQARAPRRPGRVLAIVASVVVAVTVAVALSTLGPPSQQRLVKLDQRRVEDLQRIDRLLELHVRSQGTLPADLQALARQPGQRPAIIDPVDRTPYGYEVTGARSFRVCAAFATDSAREQSPSHAEDWNHGRGRHCFERRVQGAGKR